MCNVQCALECLVCVLFKMKPYRIPLVCIWILMGRERERKWEGAVGRTADPKVCSTQTVHWISLLEVLQIVFRYCTHRVHFSNCFSGKIHKIYDSPRRSIAARAMILSRIYSINIYDTLSYSPSFHISFTSIIVAPTTFLFVVYFIIYNYRNFAYILYIVSVSLAHMVIWHSHVLLTLSLTHFYWINYPMNRI